MAKKIQVELEAKTDKAIKEIKDVKGEIQNLTKSTEEGFKDVGDATKGVSKGIKGIGTALKAAGIGLVVAAFAKLTEIFQQNQKAADFFNTSFEVVSIAFNDFVNFLVNNLGAVTGFFKSVFDDPLQSIKDLGSAIKNNIIERFNSMLDTVGLAGKAVKQFFEGDFSGAAESAKAASKEFVDVLTGVDGTVDKVGEGITKVATATSNYVKETVNAATANVQLEKSARLAETANQGLIEKYDRQAEQLRQIRDDESKSFEERIAANNELGKLLDEQEKTMMANADARVKQAEAELAKNKDNVDLQIAYQEALNEQAGIEAQITGFRSEQQTNANSLLREQKDLVNELALIGKSEREIERLELQQDYEAKKLLIEREITDEAQKNEMLLALQTDFNNKVNNLNEEASDNEIMWSEMTTDQKLEYAQKGLDGLAANLGKETAAGKAAAIASTLISTYQGAQDSYKSLAGIPVVGPALGIAAAAAAVAGGLKTVKSIQSTKTPQTAGMGSGGANISSPSRPAPPSIPPAFNIVGASDTNQLAEAIGGQAQQPVKAFVVSNDVSTAQELDRNIVEGASIG
jgi:predicted lactoylglutathione lyase